MSKSLKVVTTQDCMIAGEPVKVGTRLTLDEASAHNLLASRRGVREEDAPEPDSKPEPKSKTGK